MEGSITASFHLMMQIFAKTPCKGTQGWTTLDQEERKRSEKNIRCTLGYFQDTREQEMVQNPQRQKGLNWFSCGRYRDKTNSAEKMELLQGADARGAFIPPPVAHEQTVHCPSRWTFTFCMANCEGYTIGPPHPTHTHQVTRLDPGPQSWITWSDTFSWEFVGKHRTRLSKNRKDR